jgi:hypothetical protein
MKISIYGENFNSIGVFSPQNGFSRNPTFVQRFWRSSHLVRKLKTIFSGSEFYGLSNEVGVEQCIRHHSNDGCSSMVSRMLLPRQLLPRQLLPGHLLPSDNCSPDTCSRDSCSPMTLAPQWHLLPRHLLPKDICSPDTYSPFSLGLELCLFCLQIQNNF